MALLNLPQAPQGGGYNEEMLKMLAMLKAKQPAAPVADPAAQMPSPMATQQMPMGTPMGGGADGTNLQAPVAPSPPPFEGNQFAGMQPQQTVPPMGPPSVNLDPQGLLGMAAPQSTPPSAGGLADAAASPQPQGAGPADGSAPDATATAQTLVAPERSWKDRTINNPEFMTAMVTGLNSLRHRPDAGVNALMQLQTTTRAKTEEEQRKLDRIYANANQTVKFFEGRGLRDWAEMVRANPDKAASIAAEYAKQLKPKDQYEYKSGRELNFGGEYADRYYKINKDTNEVTQVAAPVPNTSTTSSTTIVNGEQLTPLQLAVDKKFADEWNAWNDGGQTDAYNNIDQMNQVNATLASGQNVSGGIIGIANSVLPPEVMAAINPKAVNTMELVQQIAQRNLKVVLGAQFAAKEGEELIKRVYNPALPESVNAERGARLSMQMKIAAEQKEAMMNYISQKGTLSGYEGPTGEQILKRFRDATAGIYADDARNLPPPTPAGTGGTGGTGTWEVRRRGG